jgi:hypothetical protein
MGEERMLAKEILVALLSGEQPSMENAWIFMSV